MSISLEQIKKVNSIIDKYTDVIKYLMTGNDAPDKSLLLKVGVNERQVGLIKKFFKYGSMDLFGSTSIKNKNLEEVMKILEDETLSTTQKNMLTYLKVDSSTNISNLSEQIKYSVSSKIVNNNLISVDRIRNILVGGALDKTEEEIANELKELTGDWTRKWNTVAHTELWDAKIYGEATSILSEGKLKEKTRVIKRTKPSACKHCIKHYLMPNGVTPRVFTLEELIHNGDNYGKPVSEWKPTLKSMHPNCMCDLEEVPEGYDFDDEGNLVIITELLKAQRLTARTVDKNNLVYVKKVVNNHGFAHEQGFWVKQQDADKENPSSQDEQDDANKKPVKPVEGQPTEPTQDSNIMGMNQHDGAGGSSIPGVETPQSIQVNIGSKAQEVPILDFNTLPTKQKKYLSSIKGFDYGSLMAIRNIYGIDKALDYMKSTGFNVKNSGKLGDWNRALNQVMEYNVVSGSPNKSKDLSEKVLDTLHKFCNSKQELLEDSGKYARLIYEVTGRVYPAVGVYDEDKEEVVQVAIQYGNLFFDKNGIQSREEFLPRWLKDYHNKRLPVIPLSLRKMVDSTTRDAWYYNGVRQKTAEEVEKENKKALDKVLELLRATNPNTPID